MYFKSRTEAGIALAEKVAPKYSDQPCVVIALSDGAVLVATQIALRLRCALMLLLSEAITLPREPEPIATVTQDGGLTLNSSYSDGELDEMQGEYRTYIEEERISQSQKISKLVGDGVLIRRELIINHNVILVSDGLSQGGALDASYAFLKPMAIKKLVVATPLASVPVVDRMHVLADDLYCLSVVADYMSTEHYYEVNDVPDHEVIIEIVENILQHWPAEKK